jgi:hypothetical protein
MPAADWGPADWPWLRTYHAEQWQRLVAKLARNNGRESKKNAFYRRHHWAEYQDYGRRIQEQNR